MKVAGSENQQETTQLIIDILSRGSLQWRQKMILIHSLVSNEMQTIINDEKLNKNE